MTHFSISAVVLVSVVFLMTACNFTPNNDSSATTIDKTFATDSVYSKSKTEPIFLKDELAGAYIFAIGEYIKAAYKKDRSIFDTLFIHKHPDFPNIKLHPIIEKVNILLVTQETILEKLNYRKSLVSLNIAAWVNKENSEFIIVTFFAEGKPQHNFHIYFTNNRNKNEFKLDTLYFEYAYPPKK